MRHQLFNYFSRESRELVNDAENQRVCGHARGGTHAPARFEFTCIRSRVVGSYAHTQHTQHTHTTCAPASRIKMTNGPRFCRQAQCARPPPTRSQVVPSLPVSFIVQSRPFPLTPPTVISVIRYPHLGPDGGGIGFPFFSLAIVPHITFLSAPAECPPSEAHKSTAIPQRRLGACGAGRRRAGESSR